MTIEFDDNFTDFINLKGKWGKMAERYNIKKPKIILFSGKARHGKTSSAKILTRHLCDNGKKVLRIAYGDDIKIISALYKDQDPNLDIEERAKNIFNKNSKNRTLWQDFGQKAKEDNDAIWAERVLLILNLLRFDEIEYVLIDDCRHEIEINKLRKEGFHTFITRVNRLNYESELDDEQMKHCSEIALDNYNFDCIISASNLIELEEEVVSKVIPILGV